MTSTTQLGLPLLQPSQAQKHVTVNEALARLDGLTQLVMASVTTTTPPTSFADGDAYFVPAGAVNAWDGQAGNIAVASNAGWVFVPPKAGWRGYITDQAVAAVFDGAGWSSGALGTTPSGAASQFRVVEFDHQLAVGSVSTISGQIPQYAMVFAITGRVKTAITGTATAFEVGVPGAADRYGSGLGLAQGTWFVGITGQPVTYYSATDIEIGAIGGDFAAGEIRLVVHYYLPTVPSI